MGGEEGRGGGLQTQRLQIKKKRKKGLQCVSVCVFVCVCVCPVRHLTECVLDLFTLVDGLLARAGASAQCWCLTGAHSVGPVVSLAREMSG